MSSLHPKEVMEKPPREEGMALGLATAELKFLSFPPCRVGLFLCHPSQMAKGCHWGISDGLTWFSLALKIHSQSSANQAPSLSLPLSFFFTLMSFYFFLKKFSHSKHSFFIDSTTKKKINITFNSISQKQSLLTLMYLLHFSRLSPFLLLKNTRKNVPCIWFTH